MVDRLYTVKDIAAIISLDGSPEDVRKCMRQIRHWTNNDVLSPIGGKSTGTGVSRVYDENAIYKAAIAAELVRYGVTVDMLGNETFDEWISRVMTSTKWKDAKERSKDFYLQFVFDQEAVMFKPLYESDLILRGETMKRMGLNAASAVVINVATICQRLRF